MPAKTAWEWTETMVKAVNGEESALDGTGGRKASTGKKPSQG
jgi:hypothetical protein